MTNAYPDYYPAFRCLAGSCRHTCCAGWEIDIDADALETYRTLDGPLGERLRASIAEGETPRFRLETGDGDVTGKAGFAVLSTRLIFTLGAVSFARTGSFTFADQAELSRMYSAEIEYSEENLDTLYDELYCGDGEA